MTPGLAGGPPFPAKATKNAVVAIASLEKPTVPVVVGICEIDIASLKQVQGAKGHAVRGEHWDGDEIWAWGPGGKPGGSAPEHIEGWDFDGTERDTEEGVEQLNLDDPDEDEDEGGVSLNNEAEEKMKYEPRNDFVEGEDAHPLEKVAVEDKELSTKGRNFPPRMLQNANANFTQRSMKHSGKPSSMPSIITAMFTKAIHMKA